MKASRPPGAPIDMGRVRGWLDDFAGYRHTVNEQRIDRWISQFELPDTDLAARVLDCVDFVTHERIGAAFRDSLQFLGGWHADRRRRRGQWRFAAFSSSAGESGDAMLQKFRLANNLGARAFNGEFVHRSELLTSGLGPGDHIVFVDDFAGTGQQAIDAWPLVREYLPEGPSIYLHLVAASKDAIARISEETEMQVQASIVLTESDEVFSPSCDRFSDSDKAILRRYCQRIGSRSARRFAEKGFLIVFAHGCPNNSLPILHRVTSSWEGLFRRYDYR